MHVTKHGGCYLITGTRVSLDSVIYAFLQGDSPERIALCLPPLTREQVCQAIGYYLANRSEIDPYLRLEEVDFEWQ